MDDNKVNLNNNQKDRKVKEKWINYWKKQKSIEGEASFLGKRLRIARFNILKKMLNPLDQSLSVIDIGCGGGSTLSIFKELGFKKLTGIDFSKESINHCERLGFIPQKNVFQMDANHTSFPDQSFDIVFSEGLWEHFQDPRPFMLETIRLSKKYIIVIQPNHFSIFGKLMQLGWELFSRNTGSVKEYTFPLSYFKSFLKMYGFDLIQSKSTILHEQAIMLFERNHKWSTAQKHELNYTKTQEKTFWQIPYSLKYWKEFLCLDNLKGHGVELGCGNNGLYNFTETVIGVDSINFHKQSQIQAVSEHLPFTHTDFVICCNGIDHFKSPQKAVNEMFRITDKIILWTYTHPRIISWILNKLDKTHPHHLQKKQITKILECHSYTITKQKTHSPLRFWRHTNNKIVKLKLLLAHITGVRGLLLHLEAAK